MIGQTISHYKILEKLGEGGMGVVYKAEDTKLERTVALKFLPVRHASDETERLRFLQEARAASALSHPNICHINAIEDGEGQQFIDMEYVDGTTLRQQLPVSKLSDALGYAIQIGEALAEAHSKGIVHRDIKADNIMVNSRNQVKVMDFGLAKLKGSLKLTRTSSTVGTLAYMAPEQIQGGDVDHRSDIFSFGVVFFELLTGHMPFRGDHEAAMMYSILNEQPDSIQKYRQDLSEEVDRIIRRALEKDAEDRYQSVADMVSEIRRLQKQTSRVVRPEQAGSPKSEAKESSTTPGVLKSKKTLWVVVCALVLIAAIAAYLSGQKPNQKIAAMAVLPFVNAGGDPSMEYLSDGLTEGLINSLSKLPGVKMMSRSSVFHYKGKEPDPRAVGKELNVGAVLIGRIAQRGDGINVSVELVSTEDNSHIWGEQYDRKSSEIVGLQSEISRELSKQLNVALTGEQERQLARNPTENTEAYQLFLQARFYWNKRTAEGLNKAADYFNQAIAQDPKYALAYAGLASTYALLPEYGGLDPKEMFPKAKAAANKALEFDPSLAEVHAVLGLIKEGEWDWEGAEQEFKRAIELNPNYATTHHWYSVHLRANRRLDEAMSEILRAKELDPLSLIINTNLGEVLVLRREYGKAEEQFQKVLELDPKFPGTLVDLGWVFELEGKFDKAVGEYQKAREVVGNSPYGLAALGHAYGKLGEKPLALKVVKELTDLSTKGYALEFDFATVYEGLGDREQTFRWLDKAYEERSTWLQYISSDPLWDDLRSDPRFVALLEKIGLKK